MKVFKLTAQHIEGTNWWFWYREAIATTTHAVKNIFQSDSMFDVRVLTFMIFFVPFMYIFVAPYAGFVSVRNIKKNILKNKTRNYFQLDIYNKKNIEYLTVVTMLTENQDE